MKTWNIRLDTKKNYDHENIEMVQQDTFANQLRIKLLNDGSSIDLTGISIVTITFNKPDGTEWLGTCEIINEKNGVVNCVLDYQVLAALGTVKATLKIFDIDLIDTSTSFLIRVVKDPYDGTDEAIESQSEYPILTQLLVAATNEEQRIANENERIANETGRVDSETDRVTEWEVIKAEYEKIIEEGPMSFKNLLDTPPDYVSQAGKLIKVKNEEDGLEYTDVIDGGTFV